MPVKMDEEKVAIATLLSQYRFSRCSELNMGQLKIMVMLACVPGIHKLALW